MNIIKYLFYEFKIKKFIKKINKEYHGNFEAKTEESFKEIDKFLNLYKIPNKYYHFLKGILFGKTYLSHIKNRITREEYEDLCEITINLKTKLGNLTNLTDGHAVYLKFMKLSGLGLQTNLSDVKFNMNYNLDISEAKQKALEATHKLVLSKKEADKIKTIILLGKGYTYLKIEEVLLLDERQIRRLRESYVLDGIKGLLGKKYAGSETKLNIAEKVCLEVDLESKAFGSAKEICALVKSEYQVEYTWGVNFS